MCVSIFAYTRVFRTGVHKFYKNLEATSKPHESERWHAKNSLLRTHNSRVTFEPHCYMLLSARRVWTDTIFYLRKNDWNKAAEDNKRHRTKVICLDDQALWDVYPCYNLNFSLELNTISLSIRWNKLIHNFYWKEKKWNRIIWKKEYSTVVDSKFCKYTQMLRAVMGNVYLFK
jgi:hypothetical protein